MIKTMIYQASKDTKNLALRILLTQLNGKLECAKEMVGIIIFSRLQSFCNTYSNP